MPASQKRLRLLPSIKMDSETVIKGLLKLVPSLKGMG